MAQNLYPESQPYKSHRLKVSPLHELYIAEYGNPKGQPAVFLHGGPGNGGNHAKSHRYFDPKHYRIISFDQRGSGLSTPFASLEENTTWDLVEDLEKIRKYLAIDRWLVFGGSWGSTLALAYAETHPQPVTHLVLRGIFLCREDEVYWYFQKGVDFIFPEYWEEFASVIPPEERTDMVRAYYKRLTSENEKVRVEAARAWSVFEGATIKLIPDPETMKRFDDSALPIARLECHYFLNKCWFKGEDQLINEVGRIRHIPAVIVHGRYDLACPVKNAWDLSKAWPEAKLEIIPAAGHASDEPGIITALVTATDRFRTS